MTTAHTSRYLTPEDIKRLVKSDNADDRAVVTHKICRAMERSELSEAERAAAHEIIRMMASDAAELVRRALAVTLRTSHLLPHDVALRLAKDVSSIAAPVLTHSPLFTDEDLADIIRTGGPIRQVAVAHREVLSETVTSVLTSDAVEEAVVIACANDNARFSPEGLSQIIDRFGTSAVVQKVLIHRQSLPISISERLIHMVSTQMREQLVTRHALSPEKAVEIATATRERATVDLADQAGTSLNPRALAQHIMTSGRLTPSLILRALVRGHMSFFEHALSELSGIPHDRTWLMIHDAGALGFRAIYDRAGMPARLFPTFRIAVEGYRGLMAEAPSLSAHQMEERLIERFLTQAPFAPREDLLYLYERLDRDQHGRKWGDIPESRSTSRQEARVAA